MLNPGDICPCCGNQIPMDISLVDLTLLRLIDIDTQLSGGAISASECIRLREQLLNEWKGAAQ